MSKYLDPKNDLTFKRIFGEHKHLCISLLNSMLPFDDQRKIIDIEYETGELLPEIPVLKNSIVDVKCLDSYGRQFIVEMQMFWSESFKSRVLLNASKAYIRQLNKSKDYSLLKPVYALNFVNEKFELSEDMRHKYYHHYKIVNVEHSDKQIEGLEFIFIELPKYKGMSQLNRAENKLRDLWLRFLTEIQDDTEEAPLELQRDLYINEAINYLERSAYTKGQLQTYDTYWDIVLTERSAYIDAENRGRVEGLIEGRVEGRAEGLVEGLREVVLNAWCNGFTVEQIQIITKLDPEQILRIIKQ